MKELKKFFGAFSQSCLLLWYSVLYAIRFGAYWRHKWCRKLFTYNYYRWKYNQSGYGQYGSKKSKSLLTGDTIEFNSDKFTGVYVVLYDNLLDSSDFTLNISNFAVNSGNFKMAVVHNDEIAKVIEPNMFIDYTLEEVPGTVSLVIAGESADLNFSMSQIDYELYSHDD